MSAKKTNDKLWGGAHSSESADAIMFAAASDVKARQPAESSIIPHDIHTNIAHIKTLNSEGYITDEEYEVLNKELVRLQKDHKAGKFQFDPSYEDIHSQIESVITERVGDVGKKLHTARSRNDQVTTDMYLYVQHELKQLILSIKGLSSSVEQVSQKYINTVCPGYTHHQKAVVTSFGEILLAYKVMFDRDIQRLEQLSKLYDYSPLGAATGYESLLPLDKNLSAKNLGFTRAYESSIDVITTRGEFEASFGSAVAMFMTHVSMISQTLIIFSSQAYGFVVIEDAYTTGSSIMPQKKNPDLLEIMKAKTAVVHGLSSSLTSLLQSAFVGYNRDSQYSKNLVVNLIDEIRQVPEFLSHIVSTLKVNSGVMLKAASENFVTSTGFMELLVSKKHIPMRDAKRLIEKAIAFSKNNDNIDMTALERAMEFMNITINIDQKTLDEWQDSAFQLSVRRRFGV